MNITTKILGIAVFALMLIPAGSAHAQTYSFQGYNAASQQELIAYLYQLIAQLQAQQGGYGSTAHGVTVYTTGASDITDDSAELAGSVTVSGRSARVWFEYGTSQRFDEDTETARTGTGGSYTFRADVFNLDEDETYYFRAVAETSSGYRVYGATRTFTTDDDGRRNSRNDDEPDVTTEEADDIDDDRAELNGEVDMNDFDDGLVFFVYGEDEDQVEDIEDDYDTYNEIDEDGDDLQKVRVDSSLDGDESYSEDVTGLDEDETYYFQICVEFENEDNDDEIICGGVEEFETDRNGGRNNDDEPDVTTEDAKNIEDDEAELHGEVDMNDFENGVVFFVYGEDEDQVEDIEDDYDTYIDVDEDGDDLQKVLMDSDLDGSADYELTVRGLDDDTDYYFQICVAFEDEDDDDVILCGGVEEFTTDD